MNAEKLTKEEKAMLHAIEAKAKAFVEKYKGSRSITQASRDLIPILKETAALRKKTSRNHPPDCDCGLTIPLARSNKEVGDTMKFTRLLLDKDANMIVVVGQLKKVPTSAIPIDVLRQVIEEEGGAVPDATYMGPPPNQFIQTIDEGLETFFKNVPEIKPCMIAENLQKLFFFLEVGTEMTQPGASA